MNSSDQDSKPLQTASGRSITGRTVFVAVMNTHDFGAARTFGDLRPVLMGSPSVADYTRHVTTIQEVLGSGDKDDYLLLSGPPLYVYLVANEWLFLHGDDAKFLYYDAGFGEYKEVI